MRYSSSGALSITAVGSHALGETPGIACRHVDENNVVRTNRSQSCYTGGGAKGWGRSRFAGVFWLGLRGGRGLAWEGSEVELRLG